MPIQKNDVMSWLEKQAHCQVCITPSNEIKHDHYYVTKPNGQHQFDLLYIPHVYKQVLTDADVALRYLELLGPRK